MTRSVAAGWILTAGLGFYGPGGRALGDGQASRRRQSPFRAWFGLCLSHVLWC
jgi:hypothetical protein